MTKVMRPPERDKGLCRHDDLGAYLSAVPRELGPVASDVETYA